MLMRYGELAAEMATLRKSINDLINSGVQPEPLLDRQPEPEPFAPPVPTSPEQILNYIVSNPMYPFNPVSFPPPIKLFPPGHTIQSPMPRPPPACSLPYSSPHVVHHTNVQHSRPRPNHASMPISSPQSSQPNFFQNRPRPPATLKFPPPNRSTYNCPQPSEPTYQSRTRTYTNLGRPLDQVYEQLKAAGKIGVVPQPTRAHDKTIGYNPQAVCAYHSGAPGHSTVECRLLRSKIQDLIDAGKIEIGRKEEQGPNVE